MNAVPLNSGSAHRLCLRRVSELKLAILRRWKSLGISLVWGALPLVALAFGVLLRPVSPHDYWYSLALGRVVDEGSSPHRNIFLYTLPPDASFPAQAWLGQWLMFRTHRALGVAGNAFSLGLCLLFSWLVVFGASLRQGCRLKFLGLGVTLAVVLSFPVCVVRTQMFALPLYAAAMTLSWLAFDGKLASKWLWGLVPVTALWANLHGSFVLIPGMLGLLIVGQLLFARSRRNLKSLLLVLLGTVAACLAQPLGLGVVSYVLASGSVRGVSEWQGQSPWTLSGFLTWCGVLGVLLLSWRHRRKLAVFIPWVVALSALALFAERFVVWWALSVPLVLGLCLEGTKAGVEPVAAGHLRVNTALCIFGLTFAVVALLLPGPLRLLFGIPVRAQGEGRGYLGLGNPIELVDELRRLPPGRSFHDQAIGGLLEYRLTPPYRSLAFVDQRLPFIPESVWDDYFELSRGEGWKENLFRWKIDYLLLHRRHQAGLSRAVSKAGVFAPLRRQGDYVLYLKKKGDKL